MACGVCGMEGEDFAGTPKAEVLHFIQRMLWAAHRARQAHEKVDTRSQVILDELVSIIDRLDDVGRLLVMPPGS